MNYELYTTIEQLVFFCVNAERCHTSVTVRMSAWLVAIKRNLQLKTLLGICPFQLDPRNQSVVPTSSITAYTVVYILTTIFVFPILAITVIKNMAIYGSITVYVAASTESTFVYTMHVSVLIVGLIRRQKHAKLLNILAQLQDRLQGRRMLLRRRNLSLFHLRNWFFALLYMIGPFSYMYFHFFLTFNDSLVQGYNFVYCTAITSVLLTVLHVQELVIWSADCFEGCLQSAKGTDASELNIRELCAAFDIWLRVGDCFGVQLLLNGIKDSFVMTAATFFLIIEIVNNGLSLMWSCHYVFGFLIPIILKNMVLLSAIDHIEERICRARQALLKASSNPNDNVSI